MTIHSPTIGALLFVAAVALIDTRTHRIPNALTVSGALVALVLNASTAGVSGALDSAAGLIVGLALFLPFYFARGFGAGDIKALAAVGAFVGAKGVLLAGAWTLIAGAVGGLAVLVFAGGHSALLALIRRWIGRVLFVCATRAMPQIAAPPGDPAARRFPYGAAIACGTAVSLVWT